MLIRVLLPVAMLIVATIITIFWARDREKHEKEVHEKYINDDRTS